MNILLFGTGRKYNSIKDKIRTDVNIVGLIDNDIEKQGTIIDGNMVYSPAQISSIEFDYIFITCLDRINIWKQLNKLGIEDGRIIDYTQPEMICDQNPIGYFKADDHEGCDKHILVCSHALTSTGAQNVLMTAVKILIKNHYEVKLLSLYEGIQREEYLAMGVDVLISEDIYSHKNEWNELIEWADIVFVNTLWLWRIVLNAAVTGKPVIWWLHESAPGEYPEYFFVKKAIDYDNVNVFCVSIKTRDIILNELCLDVEFPILYYGLPYRISEHTYKKEKTVFAIIGAISNGIKGHDLFVDAISKMDSIIRESSEFWIVGRGTLENHEQLIADKYDCIKIIGELPQSEISDLYQKIDVLICCSRQDAMPVVVVEACMNKKICIVSDATGVADLLEDRENALIISSGDSTELKNAMEWVINNKTKAEKMAEKAYKVYKDNFSMKVFENRLINIIQSMI